MSNKTPGEEPWRRSTFCADGQCVEVALPADGAGEVLMRCTADPATVLSLEREAWTDFTAAIKNGEFDR